MQSIFFPNNEDRDFQFEDYLDELRWPGWKGLLCVVNTAALFCMSYGIFYEKNLNYVYPASGIILLTMFYCLVRYPIRSLDVAARAILSGMHYGPP